jgi:hypothetical protein
VIVVGCKTPESRSRIIAGIVTTVLIVAHSVSYCTYVTNHPLASSEEQFPNTADAGSDECGPRTHSPCATHAVLTS